MNLADSTIHQAKQADYRHGCFMLRDSLKNSIIFGYRNVSPFSAALCCMDRSIVNVTSWQGPACVVGVTSEARWSRSRPEKEMLRRAALRCEKHAEGKSGEILIRKILSLKRYVQEAQKIPNERDSCTLLEKKNMIWGEKYIYHKTQNHIFVCVGGERSASNC